MRGALRSLWLASAVLVGVVALAISQSMPAVVQLLVNQPHALVMGGTGMPHPSEAYVDGQINNYVAGFPAQHRYAVYTPEEFWPVAGTMSFDESVVQGVAYLETEMALPGHAGSPLVIVGYSQSSRVASAEKNRLIAAEAYDRDITFVLVSDVNKGNGGIMARFPGWTIPVLGVTFDGATRTDSPETGPGDHAFDTTSVSFVHDGWSDFPIYPLNLLAVANSVAGIALLHGTYPNLDQPELIPVGSTGDTDYYVIETEIVPILMPLEQLGVPRPILLAMDEPVRVLVEAGYRRDIDPGAPTPAYLISVNNPVSLVKNFVAAIPVGIDDALEASDLGRPLGTEPSGPFGVGGDDADLEGKPAGFIPLGNPAATKPSTTVTESKPETEGETKKPELEEAELEEAEPEVEAPKKERAKPLRPKLRGPISFDPPKLPTLRKPSDRPLQRALKALTGHRPESAEKTADKPENEPKASEQDSEQDAA